MRGQRGHRFLQDPLLLFRIHPVRYDNRGKVCTVISVLRDAPLRGVSFPLLLPPSELSPTPASVSPAPADISPTRTDRSQSTSALVKLYMLSLTSYLILKLYYI